jgi:hypothetical protein
VSTYFLQNILKYLDLNFLNLKEEKLKTGSLESDLHFEFPQVNHVMLVSAVLFWQFTLEKRYALPSSKA